MSDYSAQHSAIVIVGLQASGKTTFALRYLENSPAACRFIFDDQGQAAARLKLPLCHTANQLEASLPTRWSLFSPHLMFPGKLEDAFKFWCAWVFEVSKRGPGKKIVLVDEAWRFCTPFTLPQEFAMIAQAGRVEGIELVTITQRPNRLNDGIRGLASEVITFQLVDRLHLDSIEDFRPYEEKIKTLPKFNFLSFNRLRGSVTSGKLP